MTPTPCFICLRDTTQGVHPTCAEALYGSSTIPKIHIDLAEFHTAALAMVGHTALSGVQRKLSVRISADRRTLFVAAEGGQFILKPQSTIFPHLPENEHVTMKIAQQVGLEVPACGLLHLSDQSLAYLIARFDRLPEGQKLSMEDFCQLSLKWRQEKYRSSAEQCMNIVRQFTSEPGIEALKFFRLLVFAWWTGNGDMHLKNFALVTGADGKHRLSPAYDLLSTLLVLPDDRQALPMGGRDKNFTRKQWLDFASYGQIATRAAERVLSTIISKTQDAVDLIESSYLPEPMKEKYAQLILDHSRQLS